MAGGAICTTELCGPDDRYCEGFRTTAITNAGPGTWAVVGKPPVKEPARL